MAKDLDTHQASVRSSAQVKDTQPGQRMLVAGLVVIHQQPKTAKGIVFLSLEDESGLLDLILKPPATNASTP